MNEDRALLDGLEPAQLRASAQPLPRRTLGRGTIWLLIGLRVYVLVAIPLVVYAFMRAWRAG